MKNAPNSSFTIRYHGLYDHQSVQYLFLGKLNILRRLVKTFTLGF